MIDKYIYRNLKRYGNCYINEKTYRKIGEKRLLDMLKRKGFPCEIIIHKNKFYDFSGVFVEDDVDIILQIIK